MSSYKMVAMSYAYQPPLINQELKPYPFINVNVADAGCLPAIGALPGVSALRCSAFFAAQAKTLLPIAGRVEPRRPRLLGSKMLGAFPSANTLLSIAGRVEPQLNGSRTQGGFELYSNQARTPVKSMFLMLD
ncbi:MAG: hypothetical protein ACHP6H_02865 [Legionellales bacterium]